MVGVVQFLDVAPADIFNCLSQEYMEETPFPQSVKDIAVDVSITYITPTGPSSSDRTSPVTAQTALKVNNSIDDPEVQAGAFDVLLIPGPPPAKKFTEPELDFVRKHWNNGNGATVMSVCTGANVVGAAGICDGRAVTGPRGLLSELKSKYPKAKWQDRRWVRDDSGKLWSSGGVTNGNDAVAAWIREHYPGPLSDLVLAMTDVGDRGQEYGEGKALNTLWWMITLLRVWLWSGRKSKAA